MNHEVSPETRAKTTKCRSDFTCLITGKRPICSAAGSLRDAGVFLKERCDEECPYVMAFGGGYMCKCPMRFELYERYHV